MKNLKKLAFLFLGVCGMSTLSLANPKNPVGSELIDYFLSATSVGVDYDLASSGVTGIYKFSPIVLPANVQNFQLNQSANTTESYNSATRTLTADYLVKDKGGFMGYTYTSAATTAPGNILTLKSSPAGSYSELKPTDSIFLPAGKPFAAEVEILGNLTAGVGAGHYQVSAASGVTISRISNGTTTTLSFSDDSVCPNFNPDIDVKLYASPKAVPDPAIYLGMGVGLLGFCVRRRRNLATA